MAPKLEASRAGVAEPVDQAKVMELRQQAEKQSAAKKTNEYVRTLMQLAALLSDIPEKVSLYAEAANIYISKIPKPC